ncbi:thioredoxin family protein [Aggregatimonas sangjinii]|uniref:Thioredoxin family protein n=1 Tax=Aggregatimonas sangjinii TaxID=2583587 RepID=A0A5B7SVB3_9FLAO|nr:thioredoxin family protein [Aggregatimonas sangjinii]QCX00861.1 thioredoxin family protein [Aggregatimonas sangjinii]
MKRFLILFALFLSAIAVAQSWETGYDEALSLAEETDRPLIVVFSGSDWCAPCIKLEREIWQAKDFQEYAAGHFVLYRADFPKKKKNRLSEELSRENGELSDKFNPNGYFPLVVLVNSKEQVLGTTSYKNLSPEEYITHLNSFLR